jgi:hypothetical protein
MDLSTEQSKDVAELGAMAPGTPQKAFSAWEVYQARVFDAIKTTYPDLSDETYHALVESIRSRFPADFVATQKRFSVSSCEWPHRSSQTNDDSCGKPIRPSFFQ